MQSIQSIICFNGGSAGDFLAGVCSEQLLGKSTYQLRNSGLAQLSSTFKDITEANYYGNTVAVNLTNTLPVENTHFYLDYYPQIAHKLFFIDYPDNITRNIVEIFMLKRYNNDPRIFAESFKQSFIEPIRTKINQYNILDVCIIDWTKNIKTWRNNPLLTPVYLQDYFDRPLFYNIVETVCQSKITNSEKLAISYDNWISKNEHLRQLFL
jgi:hypothetical protein